VAWLRRAVKRYNIGVRRHVLMVVFALWAPLALAQDPPNPSPTDKSASDKASTEKAAARDREAGESSSRETRIDVSAPKDDAKSHPGSKDAVAGLDGTDNPDVNDVQEFHPWNPLKASKDIQIGDFYFKRKNYKAALDRYKEALYYKQGDAVATFRVGECQEKLGDKAEAQKSFEQYLKILPEGPLAKDARASLEKMAKAQ
jgi:tetratricopeptide (TPR) repeat protein